MSAGEQVQERATFLTEALSISLSLFLSRVNWKASYMEQPDKVAFMLFPSLSLFLTQQGNVGAKKEKLFVVFVWAGVGSFWETVEAAERKFALVRGWEKGGRVTVREWERERERGWTEEHVCK